MDANNSQRVISEAIRKIALGRSAERVAMSPSGMSGVGTARMIHNHEVGGSYPPCIPDIIIYPLTFKYINGFLK